VSPKAAVTSTVKIEIEDLTAVGRRVSQAINTLPVSERAKLYAGAEPNMLICAETIQTAPPALPEETVGASPRWYAIYTRSRHEKYVQQQCEQKAVESFLPLYETTHRWKDRKVRVQLPLFPGYMFVRIPLSQGLHVRQIPGVVSLVGFNGQPAALDEEEMEALRKGLSCGMYAAPYAYCDLVTGQRVRIQAGPFAGLEGTLLRQRNDLRIILSIHLLQRSIILDVERSDIELIPELNTRPLPQPRGVQVRA
jgi:transcription antitermination factor NusG